jgi:hypothetical protein
MTHKKLLHTGYVRYVWSSHIQTGCEKDSTPTWAARAAFVKSPSKDFSTALPGHFQSLVNVSNSDARNHLFAVELNTVLNAEFQDIDDNHVGIDVNSLTSVQAASAGYYDDGVGTFRNLSLISRKAMQVWVE